MKKSTLALSALSMAAMAVPASASLLISEPFGYTAAQPIAGQTNTTSAASETWYDAGTVGSTVHQIGSPGLTSPTGFPTASGNMADLKSADDTELDRLNIPNAFNTNLQPIYGASSSLYYSLLLDVPSTAGAGTGSNHTNPNENNDIIVGFNNAQGSTGTRPQTWNGELVYRQGSASNTFNLGIRASTTDASTTYFTGDLTPGTTYLIVVEASLGASPGTASQDTNSIWVNPSSTTFGAVTAPSPDGSSDGGDNANATLDSMQSLLIGAGVATSTNPTDTYVDEIRVGNTWADVTAVPEPTTLGLASLGALGLLKRRRRMA